MPGSRLDGHGGPDLAVSTPGRTGSHRQGPRWAHHAIESPTAMSSRGCQRLPSVKKLEPAACAKSVSGSGGPWWPLRSNRAVAPHCGSPSLHCAMTGLPGRQGEQSSDLSVSNGTGNMSAVTDEEPELIPTDIVDIVHRFVRLVWTERNLRAAWPLVDDTFRQCWAQEWLYPIRDRALADGFEPDEVVAAFCSPIPDHPLWEPFERAQIRNLTSWGDLENWNIPSHRRQVTINVDLVILVPTLPPGGAIPPGGFFEGISILVRQTREGLRILNLSSDHVIPEPGWPPRLR